MKNKIRTYFIDFYIKLNSGQEMLIEVKPHKETLPPKPGARKTRKFLAECMTFETNQAKWQAARKMADEHGIRFDVWTENELKRLGILKEFAAGNKTLLRAERRAMPNSKYRVRKTTTTPKRRS